MFLNNFRKWGEHGRYMLILNKHDRYAQTQHIYLDLTNQNQSQSNYLNDLVSASAAFACTNFFINVNAASLALKSNIPQGYSVFFLDANRAPMRNDDGYEFYYHIYEPEREDNSEPWGYVPQLNSFMSEYDFQSYYYEH
ncbi:hypothetical protein JN384_06955 [Atlantibacter hermannii]|nr:hypothetical protein [Atlantibacter hermannii]MBL7635148.1 hypothetical protein [Atlantibacter hermannii]